MDHKGFSAAFFMMKYIYYITTLCIGLVFNFGQGRGIVKIFFSQLCLEKFSYENILLIVNKVNRQNLPSISLNDQPLSFASIHCIKYSCICERIILTNPEHTAKNCSLQQGAPGDWDIYSFCEN